MRILSNDVLFLRYFVFNRIVLRFFLCEKTLLNSSYASSIVDGRTKNGSLRLRCGYRALNAKTVPDKHPIPRV